MKSFEYYVALPDSMTDKELDVEFTELLDGFESQSVGQSDFVKSLLELSDRQWHTYNVLDVGIRERVEDCLISVWNGCDRVLVEDIISIMVRLGLEKIRVFLCSCSSIDVSPEVFNEISLALSELGGSVEDPYRGMR
ncbi:hypothetical protein LOY70_07730 [Pseudomonas sp. B21-054]|uniref:hypothetical protein n=1 Tax=Pseudomonas sp. B21-054 TaxID=2895494 RepID=UPI002232A839|nr:hypothetical protein [Pseudomonas sp. B21-054]UZE19478.1 hypothetical protein LOY70_07730 [Pseudomonas sp. B21-054]